MASLRVSLKSRFLLFVGAFILRLVFTFFILFNPVFHQRQYWRNVVFIDITLSVVLFVAYTIYAAAVIRTAKALGKEIWPFVIFFFALPAVIAFIIVNGGTPFAFFVQNGILSTPVVVYLLLSRDLDDEVRDYSLF